jgi:hypothetical protein
LTSGRAKYVATVVQDVEFIAYGSATITPTSIQAEQSRRQSEFAQKFPGRKCNGIEAFSASDSDVFSE